mgnify:CR=1 FL=1
MILYNWNSSSTLATVLALAIISPIIAVFFSAFLGDTTLWPHLFSTVLPRYVYNTLVLMLGVGILSSVFGISSAWVVTRYNFFGKKIFEWALLLPAAVPAYIIAYTYTDFLEYAGSFQKTLREIFNWDSSSDYWFPEIRSMSGAILVMSCVLYPYVYMMTRASFLTVPISFYQTSLIYGRNSFFSVALPLARPGIFAGLALVLMETISDFGTVEFLAVETVTLGIFNLWLGMNNFSAASQLSFLAFTFIVVLLGVELSARKNQKFNNPQSSSFEKKIEEISFYKSLILFFICLLPILFGFIIPVLILINLSMQGFDQNNLYSFIEISLNSINVSFFGAFLTILFSFIIVVAVKYHGGKRFTFLATIAGSGYAFPGVILALATTFFLSFIQNNINQLFINFNLNWNLTLIGTFTALLYTYICRFNAIGIGYINSGIQRISPNLLEAGRLQGVSFEKSLFKIIFPLIRPSILIGFLIVFVDIFKELPVTLLLRPFNFETLATYVYQYAKEEMLEQCALAALLIILIGTIPVFILNKTINLSYEKQ